MAKINFEYDLDELKEVTTDILKRAVTLGATSAQVEINESIANNVDVLNRKIETFETSYERALALTVYIGNQSGTVGISQISNHIDDIIKRALDIASYTQEDKANSLPDIETTCFEIPKDTPELNLYNPIDLENQTLIDKAINLETIALNSKPSIITSDGASVNFVEHNFVIANTNGLNLGYKTTRYNSSISLIGTNKQIRAGTDNATTSMQTDYWYTSSRDFNELASDKLVASIAADRVLRRLNNGVIKSGIYSVIFESTIAKSLIANFIGAISGGNLYRRLSFLNDSLNQQIFPTWMNIKEDPFIVKGMASCYFDGEGVSVASRDIVKDGFVKGYMLSSYSARKMGMQTTGNAGGAHNIFVKNNFSGGINELCLQVKSGLVIIETIGHGLNMVTGDYSVGASGLWVENGSVQFFVDNLTIAGNLKDIFANICYIGNDYNNGSILCGSILVEGVRVVV